MAVLLLLTVPMKANPVDAKIAQKVAETFMQAQTGTKATLQRIDYAEQTEFPHFYVFGTKSSFVIISADDCVEPVLGYSTENPFGTEKMPENLFWWLKDYDEQITDAAKSGQKATGEVAQQWKELASGNTSKAHSEVIVEPLIQTKWNQGSPYNIHCPGSNSTGCVATAMAQIMKYWEYPTTGFGSHSYTPATHPGYEEQTANFGETTYDWANMTNTYSSTSLNEEKEAVAKLMYHCGISVNMDYGSNGTSSSATTSDVVDALQSYFNYSQTAQYISQDEIVDATGQEDLGQWKNMLKAELTARRPIQYRGRKRIDEEHTSGHSFICDGYEIDANNNDKFHFNWGWGGSSDGSFVITGISYPLNQAAIFGIQPITYDAQPTGLVASVSNLSVSLIWNEVGNASSYNVYRDYVLIGNTETNTGIFTDNNAPIGNHTYFVRSVDSEGNVSLPSNIANATVEFSFTLDNLKIEHLELSYQDGNATLQWDAPYSLQYLNYYDFEGDWGAPSVGDITFYWGTRFPSSIIASGSSITSVSTYFYTPGTYTAYVYLCSSTTPTGTPTTVSGTYSKGWHTIPIESIAINDEQYIWVIFKSSGINRPTIVGVQNSDEGNYYSDDRTTWYHFTGYSFFVSASLTDGNFTYNIYDNDVCVAQNLNTPIHTLSNINPNTAHQYTVKTKLGNEETEASNMVGVTVGTASLTSLELGNNDNMTIAENSTLSVENLTNTNPANLVLEDGAQLIHNTSGVKATVKKNIIGYTNDNNGWNFIASPVSETFAPTEKNGLLSGNYDLYFYEEPTHMWKNHKKHLVDGINQNTNSNFNIEPQKGYLYANSAATTLQFAGTLTPSNNTVNIRDLSYSATELTGFNLVGNPFACNATVDKDYYVVNGHDVSLPESGHIIAPCEGILVQASENDATVTFTKSASSKGTNSSGCIDIIATQGRALIDRARMRFGDGNSLEKFRLDDKLSQISLHHDGQDLAVVYADEENELPLNFKATENGTYTIGIESQNLDLTYLHLIDNLTGIDVDLLATPDYTFEAKTTDYASRFRLVFASVCEDVDSDNENFAFINDGNIIVYKEGILQIIDMTGRIVLSGDAINRVSTNRMTPGVYILRLITANGVKTQKIVID